MVVRAGRDGFVPNVPTRGYRYELTPPVPVVVLEGRVRGGRKQPIEGEFPFPPGFQF